MGMTVRVRPDLLGGVRLRIGGHVWDASISGPFEELESTTTGGSATEGCAP
jgi:F0F1-type ATP synthase delta subunit